MGNGFLEEVSKLKPGGYVGITQLVGSQEGIRAGRTILGRKKGMFIIIIITQGRECVTLQCDWIRGVKKGVSRG